MNQVLISVKQQRNKNIKTSTNKMLIAFFRPIQGTSMIATKAKIPNVSIMIVMKTSVMAFYSIPSDSKVVGKM